MSTNWVSNPPKGHQVLCFVVPRSYEPTVAVVQVLVTNESQCRFPNCIVEAVTDWMLKGAEGRQACESSAFHFNVGDLGLWIDDEMKPFFPYEEDTLESLLASRGIVAMRVTAFESSFDHHGWSFDDQLFDEAVINEENFAEQDRRDEKRCSD